MDVRLMEHRPGHREVPLREGDTNGKWARRMWLLFAVAAGLVVNGLLLESARSQVTPANRLDVTGGVLFIGSQSSPILPHSISLRGGPSADDFILDGWLQLPKVDFAFEQQIEVVQENPNLAATTSPFASPITRGTPASAQGRPVTRSPGSCASSAS
jgi:hypothetical protein